MIVEIIKELTAKEDTSEIPSVQILSWTKRIEAHQLQKAMVDSLRRSFIWLLK